MPRRTRNGASASFAAAISSPWRRIVVGVEPRDDAHGPRVVADREVLVAALAGGLRHLEHGRLPVGPGRVHVEVAAHLPELDERS